MNRIAMTAASYAIGLVACTMAAQAGPTLQNSNFLVKAPVVATQGSSYHYLTIGKAAFHPAENGPYQLGFSTEGALALNHAVLVAPVQLPDNSVVKQMICYMYDKDYDSDIKCELVKYRLDDGDFSYIAESRTEVTDDGPVRTVVPVNEKINNLEYAYEVWARPAEREMRWPETGPNMGIKAITLRYQLAE